MANLQRKSCFKNDFSHSRESKFASCYSLVSARFYLLSYYQFIREQGKIRIKDLSYYHIINKEIRNKGIKESSNEQLHDLIDYQFFILNFQLYRVFLRIGFMHYIIDGIDNIFGTFV